VDAVAGDGGVLFLKFRVLVAFQIIQSSAGLQTCRNSRY
jgi:hypothetical protein